MICNTLPALPAGNPTQIRIIDADLGRTGRCTAEGRRGFREVVALVNQVEQAGILFAYDVTRLARNCTDWYQLLDLCGRITRHCLVGDQDEAFTILPLPMVA